MDKPNWPVLFQESNSNPLIIPTIRFPSGVISSIIGKANDG